MYTPVLSPIFSTCPAHLILLDLITRKILGEEYIIKLLIIWFSLLPCYIFPLRPKYSPQHPILKHPQSMFLPQCEWPSLRPIQNNRQNYSSVCPNLMCIIYVYTHTVHTYTRAVQKDTDLFLIYYCTYNLIRLVSFKLLPSTVDTPLPAFFPVLERVLERVLRDGAKVL